jgi:hypothetical protein
MDKLLEALKAKCLSSGLRMVTVQTSGALFQFFCQSIIKATRTELGI